MSADGLAVEGPLARNHFVKDRAKRKKVGAVIGRFSAHLLGRHVTGSAHDHAGVGRHLHGWSVSAAIVRFRSRQLG